jgi:hypothetical protein
MQLTMTAEMYVNQTQNEKENIFNCFLGGEGRGGSMGTMCAKLCACSYEL